jgi:release factor glutamine methyltransferase
MVSPLNESNQLLTVGEVRLAAQQYLEQKGVENARFVSEVLVSEVLRWDRLRVYLDFERPMSMAERDALRPFVRSCAAGEPWQYVLGYTDFHGHRIQLDRAALIPRPETELLVDRCLEALKDLPEGRRLRLADIGTGSGCILVSLMLETPEAGAMEWIGVDRHANALAVASRNLELHGLRAQARLMQSDLLCAVRPSSLDAVVANLPYIPTADLQGLQRSVRDYEPHSALDGGADGLELVVRLIEQCETVIRPGGWLGLELGIDQAAAARRRLEEGAWERIQIIRDYAGIERIVTAYRAC